MWQFSTFEHHYTIYHLLESGISFDQTQCFEEKKMAEISLYFEYLAWLCILNIDRMCTDQVKSSFYLKWNSFRTKTDDRVKRRRPTNPWKFKKMFVFEKFEGVKNSLPRLIGLVVRNVCFHRLCDKSFFVF